MAYDSNKAVGNVPETSIAKRPDLGSLQSNQERATGTGQRTVAIPASDVDGVGYTATQRKVGNQVVVGPNTKNSGVLKDPLSRYQQKFYPAVSNPSGEDLSGSRKAAGRNSGVPNL